MRKSFLAPAFVISYATFLSIGLECLLNLLGVSLAISLDGAAVSGQYPRFIPFCLIVGLVALVLLVTTFILNLKISEKYGLTRRFWIVQTIVAVVISIPMVRIWETLFEFLRKIF